MNINPNLIYPVSVFINQRRQLNLLFNQDIVVVDGGQRETYKLDGNLLDRSL